MKLNNFKNIKKTYDKKIIRTLKDMKDKFFFKQEVKNTLKKRNPKIYTVYIKRINNKNYSLTVLEPGTIFNEFFMTKGHKHLKKDKEIYILLKGKGILYLQSKITKLIKLKKNKPITISGNSIHRLINVGKTKLEVATIDKGIGKNYNIFFKKRVFK